MASKIPQMDLKQFMRRSEVLKLYRQFLRAIKQIPGESDRKQFLEWTQSDFKKNKNHSDETVIRMNILRGRKQLEELNRNINRTR